MAVTIPFSLPLTRKQRVLKLYKEILRNLESWYYYRPVFRYQATIMRARFDENKNVPEEKAMELLCEAEEELCKKEHYAIKQFPYTIRGITYMRNVHVPDWVLDYWHPLEKVSILLLQERR
ncbi:NADH dehydrogenase [ubiquinone] 1 beta subcomplex subunit 9 isoform X2 [Halyomorpha halys]|uniref:NADH dehydrogenase [ubiquinone] 1 beta subcomplex subunit 9 isoform X2 n=1 Tax=Halyomorpha halys TaxID=286706 RepID=UPI0006D4FCF0|nr:NADH dehydrogenase [ubiquinone] 1 beta subcomplex subunit 9-like isoform X2 [Halyomorpha halys]